MSSDPTLQQAIDSYEKGEVELALKQMQEVLLAEPQNPIVRLEFANMLMREKKFNDARELLNSLPDDEIKSPAVLALFGQLDSIDTVVDAPDFEALLSTLEKEPENCLAREQLSAHYTLRGDYLAAMEQLLNIVKTNRKYNEDAGRNGLLKIFATLGPTHELVSQYRKKLAQLLN